MDASIEHTVVINDEEQYSIWPTFKPIPVGWNEVGVRGAKQDCLDYIDKVWTDITPKSVREAIARDRETRTN